MDFMFTSVQNLRTFTVTRKDIRVFTPLIFHPLKLDRSLSTSTLKGGKSFFDLDPRCSRSFLLGLSKGNARVEISASFFFFFFRSATVCNSLINTHARRFY